MDSQNSLELVSIQSSQNSLSINSELSIKFNNKKRTGYKLILKDSDIVREANKTDLKFSGVCSGRGCATICPIHEDPIDNGLVVKNSFKFLYA